jgi:hypothetical protein
MRPPHVDAMLAELERVDERSRDVVDPEIRSLLVDLVRHLLAGGPPPVVEQGCGADVAAVIEQMVVDVAALDDDTVRRAAAHFADGGFADLVTASYAIEARVRMELMSAALWGAS